MDFLYSQQSSLLPKVSFNGAILLDVENFPFELDVEKYLPGYCLYPVSIKLAVANWQNNSIAKLDKYLHQQGYQLIHVPKGDNAADGHILTLGASLLLHHSNIKEVTIVSKDSIFNYLHQSLRAQGCGTYKIYHQAGNIYLHDYTKDKLLIITKVDRQKKQQTPEQILQKRINSIVDKLRKENQDCVTLSQVSNQFKQDYKQSINEALKTSKLPKSALKFIQTSCSKTITIKQKDSQYYLYLIAR